MQLASIGQNIPGEQLLSCANASRDNADSSETMYNKTHINVSVAIAGMVAVPQKYGEATELYGACKGVKSSTTSLQVLVRYKTLKSPSLKYSLYSAL